VSNKFVWQNIGLFHPSQETFCDLYGPQFDTAELVIVNAFGNTFDVVLCNSL
jgi:putative alpha-1,2-mannosidase